MERLKRTLRGTFFRNTLSEERIKAIRYMAKIILAIIFCLLASSFKSFIDLHIVPYNMLFLFKPKLSVLLLKGFYDLSKNDPSRLFIKLRASFNASSNSARSTGSE